MIGPALYPLLTGDSVIASLIGLRVYPLELPQAPTYPAVTYQVITDPREYALSGPSNLGEARVQFDCYATRYDAAIALARAVRNRLESFKGVIGNPPIDVQGAFQIGGGDEFESSTVKAGPRLWRRTLDFTIWYGDP